jgi:hypothetical protein
MDTSYQKYLTGIFKWTSFEKASPDSDLEKAIPEADPKYERAETIEQEEQKSLLLESEDDGSPSKESAAEDNEEVSEVLIQQRNRPADNPKPQTFD